MMTYSGASHNAFYVERDITAWYQDGSLWDRIAGTNGYDVFEGIYPGCYFDMSRNITAPSIGGGTAGVYGDSKILILGCNSLYNNGYMDPSDARDPSHGIEYIADFNHIVCCPYYHFGQSKMNNLDSNNQSTTVGSYYNSLLSQQVIGLSTTVGNINGTINEQLYAEFGNHLKTIKEHLANAINENVLSSSINEMGRSTSFSWYLCQAVLMSEVEVYGSVAFSSCGFDVTTGRRQFPAFFYNNNDLNRKYKYWLKAVTSKLKFAVANASGSAHFDDANKNTNYVRPRFILA